MAQPRALPGRKPHDEHPVMGPRAGSRTTGHVLPVSVPVPRWLSELACSPSRGHTPPPPPPVMRGRHGAWALGCLWVEVKPKPHPVT